MKSIEPLTIQQLYNSCDVDIFHFSDTSELELVDIPLGQDRAIEAINFALDVTSEGFNIFAMGIPSARKEQTIEHLILHKAKAQNNPNDWCYVNNFVQPNRPLALSFPGGQGHRFKNDMHQLIDDLRNTIPAAFESNEYQVRRQILEQKYQEKQSEAINKVRELARQQDIELLATPSGFTFAPKIDGETITNEIFQALPESEKAAIETKIVNLQQELNNTARQFPLWQRETFREIKALDQEVALSTVENLVMEIQHDYGKIPGVQDYLAEYQRDVIENVRDFLITSDAMPPTPLANEVNFARYEVNLLVDQRKQTGAPIVYLNNPNIENLLGRVEHQTQFGTLSTDLTLIQAGALHEASGGYLIVDIEKILTKPFAWEALKRCLISKEIKIETLERSFGFMASSLLEPEPIPLEIKVILIGSPELYYLLAQYDSDFNELFRVVADFDDRLERNEENCKHYAQLVSRIVKDESLAPFSKQAVARIVEFSSRLSGNSHKIALDRDALRDLMIEANYQAKTKHQEIVSDVAVETAIESQKRRSGRIKERYYEQIIEDTVFIDTNGEQVGQINGLAVISLGEFSFGKPSRITARTRAGNAGVLDIERKVELGGALHSKGVLILSSYLAAKYSGDQPLSLSASLVFEQSYSGVDGDSASSTELYALLSALANKPIKQSIAVTGSVNQFGQIQAIGGANEKIEGFFEICKIRGLTGEQGVIIPHANVKNLMLRRDVLQAVADKQFAIYAVSTVDEGLEILTGLEAGEADSAGNFPQGSLNHLIVQRLNKFAQSQKNFQNPVSSESGKESHEH